MIKKIGFIVGIVMFVFSFTISAQLSGFTLTGNAENASGAKWTYSNTVDGVVYELQGILYKPAGNGPFPAVIINHGTGGSSLSYSTNVARQMIAWGYICIATNYTHAAISTSIPCGSPGDCADQKTWGASNDNLFRAMKCWDILASLNYVDTFSIAAFGHSRGAFLTIALAGIYPEKFSCFGHTAGGVGNTSDGTYASEAVVNKINKPYIFHHGDADVTVPIVYDNNLEKIFIKNGLLYNYYIYPGLTHQQMSTDATMFTRTKDFFNLYITRVKTGLNINSSTDQKALLLQVKSKQLKIENANVTALQIYNLTGQQLLSSTVIPNQEIDISSIRNSLYICKVSLGSNVISRKIIVQ